MVQQNQFGGSSQDDPNVHLASFLETYDIVKMNGFTKEANRQNRGSNHCYIDPSLLRRVWLGNFLLNHFLLLSQQNCGVRLANSDN